MTPENLDLAAKLTSPSYISLASNSLSSLEKSIRILLSQRVLPEKAWDDLSIKFLLQNIALMDTNNFYSKIGVGERESRIYSSIVLERNFYMGHGIGRSGDINSIQPKAVGSSLILKLTEHLVKDAIKIMNIQFAKSVLLLPLATGMSITMVLLLLSKKNPKAKYILWPRIDQKTCLKCIFSANLTPIIIEGNIKGDEIETNIDLIEKKIEEIGQENILGILSTTSCFAARVPDDVQNIALIAKKYNFFHIVNNAYGLQCSKIAFELNQAHSKGRIDAVIQSTDKNFMVPIGGAIVFSPEKSFIKDLGEFYPGRASAGPILDLFITLLSMGKENLIKLLEERKVNYSYMRENLIKIAEKYKERVYDTPRNTISIAISLNNLEKIMKESKIKDDITSFGAILYGKRIMGSRVISKSESKEIGGFKFQNYGSNIENYQGLPYFTVASAIGMKKNEIDDFIKRLDETFKEFYKKYENKEEELKFDK